MKVFWRWIIMAIWHGATTYFGSVYVSNTLLLVKLMLTLSCTGIGWPDWRHWQDTVTLVHLLHCLLFDHAHHCLQAVHWDLLLELAHSRCQHLLWNPVLLRLSPGDLHARPSWDIPTPDQWTVHDDSIEQESVDLSDRHSNYFIAAWHHLLALSEGVLANTHWCCYDEAIEAAWLHVRWLQQRVCPPATWGEWAQKEQVWATERQGPTAEDGAGEGEAAIKHSQQNADWWNPSPEWSPWIDIWLEPDWV